MKLLVNTKQNPIHKQGQKLIDDLSVLRIDAYPGNPTPGTTIMDLAAKKSQEGYKVAAISAASAYHVGGGCLTGLLYYC